MMSSFTRVLLKCFVYFALITTLIQVIIYAVISIEDDFSSVDHVILWWTPFSGNISYIRQCGIRKCLITSNRQELNNSKLKVMLMYGSQMQICDLPKVRNPDHLWGLYHEESPRNRPELLFPAMLSLFNFSSTISRHSYLPLTLQYLTSLDDLTSKKYVRTWKEKTAQQPQLAPIVYIQRDCVTPTNRDTFVQELMKYVPVDSYGACLNNKQLPTSLQDPLGTMLSDELFKFISLYKFAIAIENGICDDYITEKLWRPLISGVVPIYIGSPSIKDWLPHPKSAILPEEFENIQKLSEYILLLNRSENDYNSHLKHKQGNISNQYLINHFTSLTWKDETIEHSFSRHVEQFECLACAKAGDLEPEIVNQSSYNCPEPVSVVSRKHNYSNWWHTQWEDDKMRAQKILEYYNNPSIGRKSFNC